jgi:hypothetical protein
MTLTNAIGIEPTSVAPSVAAHTATAVAGTTANAANTVTGGGVTTVTAVVKGSAITHGVSLLLITMTFGIAAVAGSF